jgi:hypothetical protein
VAYLEPPHGVVGFLHGMVYDFLIARVPLAAPLVVAAVPLLVWAQSRRGLQRRAGASLCPACGYDLRAAPERCLECGGWHQNQTPARKNAAGCKRRRGPGSLAEGRGTGVVIVSLSIVTLGRSAGCSDYAGKNDLD